MKNVMIVLILIVASCKPVKQVTTTVTQKEAFLEYSKGQCLGRCPVYNIRVFDDGMVVYEGRDRQRKKISIISQLSREEVQELTLVLGNTLGEPNLFKRIRDRPITALTYKNKEYKYHASKIDGKLKEVNARLEDLVAQVIVK
jgi:hypothetical protein